MIPDGWEKVLLGDIASPEKGAFVDGPFGSNLKTSEFVDEGVRIIQLQNIGDGDFLDKNHKYVTYEKAEELNRHTAISGDIIIAKMAEPIFRAAVVPEYEKKWIFVADCMRLRVNRSLCNHKFACYMINDKSVRSQAEKKGTGTTRKRINLSSSKTIDFLLPPLSEQKKIAAILSSVDDAIQATQKVIDQTEKVKQGMLQELLSKGIGHTEFKKTEIGEIPVEWEVCTIGDYCDVIDPQPDHRTPPTITDGIPYIGMADIKGGGIDIDNSRTVSKNILEKQKESFDIYSGAFVFGKIGTIGYPTIIPTERAYAYSANLILLTSENKTFIDLLYWIVQSPIIENQIKSQTNTTSQPALGIKKVRNFKIPVMGVFEQNELTTIFTSLQADLDKNGSNLERLWRLKKGLMQDLLTGKVRV